MRPRCPQNIFFPFYEDLPGSYFVPRSHRSPRRGARLPTCTRPMLPPPLVSPILRVLHTPEDDPVRCAEKNTPSRAQERNKTYPRLAIPADEASAKRRQKLPLCRSSALDLDRRPAIKTLLGSAEYVARPVFPTLTLPPIATPYPRPRRSSATVTAITQRNHFSPWPSSAGRPPRRRQPSHTTLIPTDTNRNRMSLPMGRTDITIYIDRRLELTYP